MYRRLLLILGPVAVTTAALAGLLGASVFGDGSEDGRSVWPESLDRLASGVGLVELLDCRGEPLIVDVGGSRHKVTGSGFLVGSRVVMTAEHMLPRPGDGACGMRVRLPRGGWHAVVDAHAWRDGRDRRGIDVATLTLADDASGHIFTFASDPEPIGARLAMLRYPLGGPFRVSRALVTRKVVQWGKPRVATKTTPEAERGNSGGPLVNDEGEVVSVLSGVILWANPSGDGTYRFGGIDLPLWWGESIRADLCRAHPRGGIPGCDPNATGEWGRMPVRRRLSG